MSPDTARIKTRLAQRFPGVAFSVNKKTGCEHRQVTWTDGPSAKKVTSLSLVEPLVTHYMRYDSKTHDWEEVQL